MKIRKVPADWLDAPRPRGRGSAAKNRGPVKQRNSTNALKRAAADGRRLKEQRDR